MNIVRGDSHANQGKVILSLQREELTIRFYLISFSSLNAGSNPLSNQRSLNFDTSSLYLEGGGAQGQSMKNQEVGFAIFSDMALVGIKPD